MSSYVKYVLIILLVVISVPAVYLIQQHIIVKAQKQGDLIIITGISSSGKSSVAKALQNLFAEQNKAYLKMSLDTFFEMLPKKWVNFNPQTHKPASMNPEGIIFETVADENGPKIIEHRGKIVEQISNGIIKSVIGFISTKNNVIAEGAISKNDLMYALKKMHDQGYCTFVVALKVPLAIARQQEIEREGFIGMARGQLEQNFFDDSLYDLIIDNSDLTSEQAAEKIYAFYKLKQSSIKTK